MDISLLRDNILENGNKDSDSEKWFIHPRGEIKGAMGGTLRTYIQQKRRYDKTVAS